MTTDNNNRSRELSESDYEIEDGQPDINGWDVKDVQGHPIGKVDDLIFDTKSQKVRYLVVTLNKDLSEGRSRNVLVPIGLAELMKEDDDVILPSVSVNQFGSLPDYKNEPVTNEQETAIRIAFAGIANPSAGNGGSPAASADNDFYNHEHFDENSLYKRRSSGTPQTGVANTANPDTIQIIEENLRVGKRTVDTSGVRLNSRLVETPVEKDISLREETVRVDKAFVNRPATDADFQEGTIELTELAEVPVVTKEAYVVEEIMLNKEVQEKEEIIKDTVRSTEVDVERFGKDGLISPSSGNKN